MCSTFSLLPMPNRSQWGGFSTRLACRSNYLFIYLTFFFSRSLLSLTFSTFLTQFRFWLIFYFLTTFATNLISRIFRFSLLTKFLKLRMKNFSIFTKQTHSRNWNLLKRRKMFELSVFIHYPSLSSTSAQVSSATIFSLQLHFLEKLFFTSFSKFSILQFSPRLIGNYSMECDDTLLIF